MQVRYFNIPSLSNDKYKGDVSLKTLMLLGVAVTILNSLFDLFILKVNN
jgi:hypothetical protein